MTCLELCEGRIWMLKCGLVYVNNGACVTSYFGSGGQTRMLCLPPHLQCT
jgi:hypothetical protein